MMDKSKDFTDRENRDGVYRVPTVRTAEVKSNTSDCSGYSSLSEKTASTKGGQGTRVKEGFRPLPSYKKKCLNELWPELISGIQLQTLSGHLIKKNVITIDDLTEINDCQSPAEKKNRLLLCILRGGERALDDFILCLREDTDDRAHTELGQTLRDALMHVRPQCGWSPGTRHFKFVPIGSTDAGDENATDESDFHKRKSERRWQWLQQSVQFRDKSDCVVLLTDLTHWKQRRTVVDGWKVLHDGQMKFAVLLSDVLLLLIPRTLIDSFQWLSNTQYICSEVLLLRSLHCPMPTDHSSLILRPKKDELESLELRTDNRMQTCDVTDTVTNFILLSERMEISYLSSYFSNGDCKCTQEQFWKKSLRICIYYIAVSNLIPGSSLVCAIKVGKEPVCKVSSALVENDKARFRYMCEFGEFCSCHHAVSMIVMREEKFTPDVHIGSLNIPIASLEDMSRIGKKFRLQDSGVETATVKMDLVFSPTFCADI